MVIGHSMGGLIALLLCARGLSAGVLLTPAAPATVLSEIPALGPAGPARGGG